MECKLQVEQSKGAKLKESCANAANSSSEVSNTADTKSPEPCQALDFNNGACNNAKSTELLA